MTEATGIYGHEVLQILADHQGSLAVEALRAQAAAAFGPQATYCNCHGDSFDFDGLMAFLGSKGKLVVRDGVVSLGFVPACIGHS
jgi:probable metal-binding protein